MSERRTCRREVLDAMLRLEARSGKRVFDLTDVITEVESATQTFAPGTIRTQVVSVMCADAPVHHANHTDGLERVERGRYRLTDSGRTAAMPSTARRSAQSGTNLGEVDAARSLAAEDEWHWEGRVQAVVIEHLTKDGWTLDRQADTATRETGPDIVMTRGDTNLLVEVKGFPSRVYARGPKAGLPKPTQPTIQARHWFAGAVVSAMLLRDADPDSLIAVALPAFGTYRRLSERVAGSFQKLGFGILLVAADGTVDEIVALDRLTADPEPFEPTDAR